MKKIFIYTLPALAFAMASCADGYEGDFKMDKPESVDLDEYISSFDVLSQYSAKAGVNLGVSVNPDDFSAKGLAFSIVKTNFNEVECASSITPSALINENNVYSFTQYSDFVETAQKSGIKVFGPALCSDVNIPSSYLKSVIADVVIPYQPWNEMITVADFENESVGTQYPSQNKAVGKVDVKIMDDPLGKQGKVLGGTKLTMDIPMLEVTLPEGFTLADVSRITLKYLLVEGKPGQARIQIESSGLNDKVNLYANVGQWEDFIFDLANIKFKAAELKLNKFKLAVGGYGANVSCCIDDIKIRLEHSTGDDTVIVKTPEEKTEIINGELYKWVDGITDIKDCYVKDYIIFDQPLESANAKFYWKDYLGDKFVADVQKHVIEKAGNDAKFYVSQNFSMSDQMPAEVAALKAEIQNLEAAGVRIDGINIVLNSSYSLNPDTQASIDAVAADGIKSLASLGKPIRLASLKIGVVNENGANVNATSLSVDQRKAVGEYYNLIIGTFRAELGNNAQTVSFSSVFDTESETAPWQKSGNRSYVYEGIVNGLSK